MMATQRRPLDLVGQKQAFLYHTTFHSFVAFYDNNYCVAFMRILYGVSE